MELTDYLQMYFQTEDTEKKLELLAVIAHALRGEIIKAFRSIPNDIKIDKVLYSIRRKTILIKAHFTHPYLSTRYFVLAIKFSTQKSKKIVPSQVEKYVKKVKDLVDKELFAKKQYKYDLTTIILAKGFSSGVSMMRRMIEEGKFFYTATPETLIEVIENLVEYFKARVTSFAEKLAETKRNLESKGIQGRFDKGIEAIKQLLKVVYKLKGIITRVKDLVERDFYEIAMKLIEDESYLDELDLFF